MNEKCTIFDRQWCQLSMDNQNQFGQPWCPVVTIMPDTDKSWNAVNLDMVLALLPYYQTDYYLFLIGTKAQGFDLKE